MTLPFLVGRLVVDKRANDEYQPQTWAHGRWCCLGDIIQKTTPPVFNPPTPLPRRLPIYVSLFLLLNLPLLFYSVYTIRSTLDCVKQREPQKKTCYSSKLVSPTKSNVVSQLWNSTGRGRTKKKPKDQFQNFSPSESDWNVIAIEKERKKVASMCVCWNATEERKQASPVSWETSRHSSQISQSHLQRSNSTIGDRMQSHQMNGKRKQETNCVPWHFFLCCKIELSVCWTSSTAANKFQRGSFKPLLRPGQGQKKSEKFLEFWKKLSDFWILNKFSNYVPFTTL